MTPTQPTTDLDTKYPPKPNRVKLLTSLTFSDDEWNIIYEGLRIAQLDLCESANTLAVKWPGTPLVETLRKWGERMGRLRRRIERRA